MERSEAKPESADGGASDGRVPLRDHIRDILDSLPAGVLTVDRDWRVTSLNLAAQGLLGVTEAEALGRLCRKVMQTDGCIGECPLRITLETGRSVSDYEVTATAARADWRSTPPSCAGKAGARSAEWSRSVRSHLRTRPRCRTGDPIFTG